MYPVDQRQDIKQIVSLLFQLLKDHPYIPCFPDNKTGLVLIFNPKFTLGIMFRGCHISIYQKMKLQS